MEHEVSERSERIEAAKDEVVRLTDQDSRFRMSIPAEPKRDSDLLLMDGLDAGTEALADLAAAQAVIAETIAHHDFRSVPTCGDDYDIVCACGYISLDGENDVCPTVRLLAQSSTDALAADRARVRAELVAKINERLDRPMRPYGDPTFPLIPERVFLRDAYDDDLVNDLEAILALGDES
jgi:hypothetical protein